MPENRRRLRSFFATFIALSSFSFVFFWQPFLPFPITITVYEPGSRKTLALPPSRSRTLVVARTSAEDVRWVYDELEGEQNLTIAVYTVDNASGPYTVPENKGHEVMPYLTYIADHYDRLSDVTIFMHAHRISWHNNDLLDSDSSRMIKRLSTSKVLREGYMNMRCHQSPGCPLHIHPLTDIAVDGIPEAAEVGRAWKEIFPPNTTIPTTLSQPCCGQFAVSAARLRSLPRTRYLAFRDWLQATTLSDRISGRIWEYLWQYLFAGQETFCPAEHVCYCEGYGICFGGPEKYDEWFRLQRRKMELEKAKKEIEEEKKKAIQTEEPQSVPLPETEKEISRLNDEMAKAKEEAVRRGRDPRLRAEEAGRPWREGDEY